jgi:hypothetical protein
MLVSAHLGGVHPLFVHEEQSTAGKYEAIIAAADMAGTTVPVSAIMRHHVQLKSPRTTALSLKS